MSRCQNPECDRVGTLSRGLCKTCYSAARRAGRVSDLPTCSVDDCTNTAHSRGVCRKHYARLLRNGTTELRSRPATRTADGAKKKPTPAQATHLTAAPAWQPGTLDHRPEYDPRAPEGRRLSGQSLGFMGEVAELPAPVRERARANLVALGADDLLDMLGLLEVA